MPLCFDPRRQRKGFRLLVQRCARADDDEIFGVADRNCCAFEWLQQSHGSHKTEASARSQIMRTPRVAPIRSTLLDNNKRFPTFSTG